MFQLPVEKGRTRTITKWDEIIATLNLRTEQLISKRYDKSALERTLAYDLLNLILSNIELDVVLPMADDIDKYFGYFIGNHDKFTKLFSDAFNVQPKASKFVKLHKLVQEYLVPTSRTNPIISLPIGYGYDVWKTVPSIKILAHNSYHLPKSFRFNLNFGTNDKTPSYIIIGIDIFVLCMKFIKFYNASDRYDLSIMREQFIREEFRGLIQDSTEVYLKNLIKSIVYDQSPIKPSSSLVNNFDAAINFLDESIDSVFLNSWSSSDWLSTKWINGKSYIDLYGDLIEDWTMADTRQNMAIEFLIFEPLLSVMSRLGEAQFDMGFNIKFRKALDLYLHKARNNKVWANNNVRSLKNEIQEALKNMV